MNAGHDYDFTREDGGGMGGTLRGEGNVEIKSVAREAESFNLSKPVPADKSDKTKKIENGSPAVSSNLKDTAVGGLSLERESLNNTLLLERLWQLEDRRSRELGEKEEQIKKLQNLLASKDELLNKLINRLSTSAEFEKKATKLLPMQSSK